MSRIRTIKPDLTLDEELATLGFAARYFFINLWCHCDREGRAEDRPQKLQALILPWDQISADMLLSELHPHFVLRYEVNGKKYLQVRTFLKHQRPNNKENKSEIPEPSMSALSKSRQNKGNQGRTNLDKGEREGKGREREGKGKGMDIAPLAHEPVVLKPETPIQKTVRAYKHAKDIDQNDKAWDKANFGRYAKSAASILAHFGGDVEKTAAYIFLRAEDLNEAGCEWTLETVTRHAYDGLGLPKQEKNGNQSNALGADRTDGPGRNRGITSAGSLASDALRRIQDAIVHSEKNRDLAMPGNSEIIDEGEVF